MSPLAKGLLLFIRGYQYLFSSLMGRSCRFYPTCSTYAAKSIREFGAVRGAMLAVWRILRCHPWNRGGHDPVPERWQSGFCCDKNARISEE